MAQLVLKEVRNPVKRVRAQKILDILNAADVGQAAGQSNVYDAAGAIDPADDVAVLDATSVGMAMTLADGTTAGETMKLYLRSITNSDTVVLTPANLAGGTTITFDAVGEYAVLIWNGAAWAVRSTDATVA
jgi:hypothetical protein